MLDAAGRRYQDSFFKLKVGRVTLGFYQQQRAHFILIIGKFTIDSNLAKIYSLCI